MNIRSLFSNGFMNLFSTANPSNNAQLILGFYPDIYTKIDTYLTLEDKINLKQVCTFFTNHKFTELKNEELNEKLNKIYSIFREEMHTQLLIFLANKYKCESPIPEDLRDLVEKTEDQLSNSLATLSRQSARIWEQQEMLGLLFIAACINYYVNGIQAPVFLEKIQPNLLISTHREFFFHLSLTNECGNDHSTITLSPGLVFIDHHRILTYKNLLLDKITRWCHSEDNNELINESKSLICQMLFHFLPFAGHEIEKTRIHTAIHELLGEQHERLSKLAKALCKAIALKLAHEVDRPAPKNSEDESELIENFSLKCNKI